MRNRRCDQLTLVCDGARDGPAGVRTSVSSMSLNVGRVNSVVAR